MLDIPEIPNEENGTFTGSGGGSSTAGNTTSVNYRLDKYTGYNEGANKITAVRGGFKPKGYKDANGFLINGTEYKFWINKINAARGNVETAQDNFFKYVPYPIQKETVYGVINKTLSKTDLLTAVKERLFQINSHLALLSYAGNNIATIANAPKDLDELIIKGFSVIATIIPATKPLGIISSLYIGYQDQKDKSELMADLNDIKIDINNLSNEAKKLTEILKENNISKEEIAASNSLLTRSAKLTNSDYLGLAGLFIGGLYLFKQSKKRKK